VRRRIVLTAFVLTAAAFAGAQTAPAAKSGAEPEAAKIAKIREIINLIGTPRIAVEMMKTQAAAIKKVLPFPPAAQDDFEKEFLGSIKVDDLVDLIVPIYARHLSEADVDGMLAFYRGPVGRRIIKALPEITAESQRAGQEWGQAVGMRVGRRIGEKVERGDYGPTSPSRQDSTPEKH